ncbi:hypothetical protein B9Z19DRAFT_1083834 [Tuber borchii]|uniref:Uncharacterized protein n=1 Tax=Tuber borchii TaxID=42251 RepID=A0A2T6ZSV5_TUBBO|nr:hypothetical protein B9Z19DRAFT_1083834 [Tuber borchii]
MNKAFAKINAVFQPKVLVMTTVETTVETVFTVSKTAFTMFGGSSWLHDKLTGRKPEPIKLYLPTHDMFWKVPYECKPLLANQIDEILKGIQQTHAAAKRKQRAYLASISSYGIGMPTPGRWVLVDLKDSSFIHKTYMEGLVFPGGEYIVLCMGATEIPRELLRPLRAGGRGQNDEDGDGEFEDAEDGEVIDEVS